MSKLFLFTQYFPFREGAETFIENEIPIAAKYFDQIYVVPTMQFGSMRNTPGNVTVISPPFRSKFDILKFGLCGLRPNTIAILIKEYFRLKAWRRISSTRAFIIQSFIFSALLHSKSIKAIKMVCHPEDILYSYWGIGWGMVIPFLKKIQNKYVTRFHRGDLYADRGNCLLFRKELLLRLNQAVFISKHGEIYQHNAYPDIQFNSQVSYLGTKDNGVALKSSDGKYRIVSCSHIVPVKRVSLIFKALLEIDDENIEWTHIGGKGEGLDEIKGLIESTPHLFKVKLLGEIKNYEVIQYFRNNPVDTFINVSSSEGLPVSIMEAISFDIPVVATNVGGTSEIVTPSTGLLLNENPTTTEISEALIEVQKREYSPRKFWMEHFNADRNYNNFYIGLLS